MVNANDVSDQIKGYRKFRMLLQTRDMDWIENILTDTAYIDSINYRLLFLNSVTDKGREHVRRRELMTVYLAGGGEMNFPPRGRLHAVHGYWLDQLRSPIHAHAVIAPGQLPKTPTDLSLFHSTHGPTGEERLLATAKSRDVILEGTVAVRGPR